MRATQNLPTELIYNEINIGKSKTVRYFELSKGNNTSTPLTILLRLSDNRMFAKSKPKYWLSTRDLKKWATPNLTGLFPTSTNSLYFGDHNRKESLLLFDLSNPHTLKVKFYKGYYPNYNTIQRLLNSFK